MYSIKYFIETRREWQTNSTRNVYLYPVWPPNNQRVVETLKYRRTFYKTGQHGLKWELKDVCKPTDGGPKQLDE